MILKNRLHLSIIMFLALIFCLACAGKSSFLSGEDKKNQTNLNPQKTGETKKAQTLIPPPKKQLPGNHIQLTSGTLYIADFFDPSLSDKTDIVFFFHGASWCSEQNFYDARKNAILISISLKDYQQAFKDPDALGMIIDEALISLKRENVTQKPLGRICLSSFSGGYSAVREILRQDRYIPLISDVLLADSLYFPKIKDGNGKEVPDPEAMAPFLKYAKMASEKKIFSFWFTHLFPPEEKYRDNSTTIAASYLIDHLGAKRVPANEKNTRGAKQLYRADLGNFHVIGYAGMVTQDHFEHFYSIVDLFKEISFVSVKK